MNVAQMLQMKVTPLEKWDSPKSTRKVQTNRNFTKMHEEKQAQTLARYRAAVGDMWFKPEEAEKKLGLRPRSSKCTLLAWLEAKKIERRKIGKGYEWRMVNEGK